MKKLLFLSFTLALFIACKQKSETAQQPSQQPTISYEQVDLSVYPQNVQQIFKAHGGLQLWSEMRSMTYDMNDESQTVDLKNRNILVEKEKTTIGSIDGKVWIAQDSAYFPPQRARFYHNLMFYFYAMPFIIADDGIIYTDAAPLEKDGVSYPAIQISYQANVGDSPDDEYIIYYHPTTHQMTWLAYTVTYGKDGKSTDFRYIHYNKWQDVDGLLLPQEMTWYTVENGLPTTPKDKPRIFTRVDVDRADMGDRFYTKPDNGVFVDE